jgi:hypothetical protein
MLKSLIYNMIWRYLAFEAVLAIEAKVHKLHKKQQGWCKKDLQI